MATPTAICPVCFVRFPVAETTSTPTACPACAYKFAAPVRDDDEPVAADIVDDSSEDGFRKESRREARVAADSIPLAPRFARLLQ